MCNLQKIEESLDTMGTKSLTSEDNNESLREKSQSNVLFVSSLICRSSIVLKTNAKFFKQVEEIMASPTESQDTSQHLEKWGQDDNNQRFSW